MKFEIDRQSFEFYVDDEYKDFDIDNPVLHLCLVLRELEGYELADDYLIWCKERFIDPADSQALVNYRNLGRIYSEVEKIIGTIDSHISDLDFELNAGAAQSLRAGNK